MQVFENIFLVGGDAYDSNIYVIDGEVIVDTGTGEFFTKIKQSIIDIGIDELRVIVNTHAHYDHVGGNGNFKEWLPTVEFVAHTADADHIERGEIVAELFGKNLTGSKIDERLEDGDVLRTKHFNFVVVHTPGHTKGSICLYESSKKILISGDTIFADGIGRTDLSGGSMGDMLESIKRLSKLDIDILLPGHGDIKVKGIKALFDRLIKRYC
ncbi:MAG: MBL fold metallo-hydrolase [Candidatus Aenigmatarchaeota archaeon]